MACVSETPSVRGGHYVPDMVPGGNHARRHHQNHQQRHHRNMPHHNIEPNQQQIHYHYHYHYKCCLHQLGNGCGQEQPQHPPQPPDGGMGVGGGVGEEKSGPASDVFGQTDHSAMPNMARSSVLRLFRAAGF